MTDMIGFDMCQITIYMDHCHLSLLEKYATLIEVDQVKVFIDYF